MIATLNPGRLITAFKACCALLALGAFSAGAHAQAGYVHEAAGAVSIQAASSPRAAAAKTGDAFEADTVFRTGIDGKLILKFADGQVLALSADSALRVGQYRFDPGSRAQNSSALVLMEGEMRYLAGTIGATHRAGVRIQAGNSEVNILRDGGADFMVKVVPAPQEVGYAIVALGEISVRTPYGLTRRIEPGQYVPWRPGQADALPVPSAAAPAVVQAEATGMWTTLLPPNTPVTVAAAQRAVATAALGPAMAAAASGAEAKLAGYVEAISNTVTLKPAAGAASTAGVGTTFAAGATFSTGADGRAVLKFADGQIVILGQASTLVVSGYQFDPGDAKTGNIAIHLVDGAVRVLTGTVQVENPPGVRVTAGASIVDILNTGPADFTVVVDTKNQEIGVARVSLGEIGVHTPYGPIDTIKANQSSLWGPEKTAAPPAAVASALALVQAAVTLQLSDLPDTQPVVVGSAAFAAAAVAAANRAQAAAAANPQSAELRAAAETAAAQAKAALQESASANEAQAARAIAATLEESAPATAGPVLAEAPQAAEPALPLPVVPTTTPGAGGGCLGSAC